MTQPVEDPGFLADVKQAYSVWTGSLLVPGFYLLMGLSSALIVLAAPAPVTDCTQKVFGQCPQPPGSQSTLLLISFLTLPFSVFYVGMAGTARLWYFRRFHGADLTASEIWTLSWKFWGRFFLLFLLIAGVGLPGSLVGVVLLAGGSTTGFTIALSITTVVIDVLFTFVTPGLALYQPSVMASFKGGLRILASTWPHCALYAVIPPLGLTLMARFGSAHLPHVVAAIAAFTGPPLTLLFAGATTSFLLRRFQPMSINGSLGPYALGYPELRQQV